MHNNTMTLKRYCINPDDWIVDWWLRAEPSDDGSRFDFDAGYINSSGYTLACYADSDCYIVASCII